jgi:H+/Cl- antiporter ClcA
MDSRALTHWTGLVILVVAAVLSNLAVKKMAQVVNSQWTGHERVHWELKNDGANKEVIGLYRANNPNGPLFRNFLLACGLFVVGVVIMFLKDLP